MSSLRYRLEQELWAVGCQVGVLPSDRDAPQLQTFPVFLPHGVNVADVKRVLADVAGRLGLPSLSCLWRDDGLLELHVPKRQRQQVTLTSLNPKTSAEIPWLLGTGIDGKVLLGDVATWPHGLVAGTTGSGKSTAVNAALCFLLARRTPQQLRTVFFDPKQVDFAALAAAPHNLAHITDMDAAEGVLGALLTEMNTRMARFGRAGVRDIDAYNRRAKTPLPRVLVVFDELAAAMDINGKALEPLLMVLLQQSRAAGIHFLLILQRPDGEVMPVRLRNNVPVRVTFRVADPSASRLILNDASACDLLGRGDGLWRDADGVVTRFQAPFVTDDDIAKTLQAAKQMPPANDTIESLGNITPKLPNLAGLSAFDAAVLLASQRAWISSGDLLEHNICNSRSQAKKVLSELRERGYIGGHDPAQNKSPVVIKRTSVATNDQPKSHVRATTNALRATNDHPNDHPKNRCSTDG